MPTKRDVVYSDLREYDVIGKSPEEVYERIKEFWKSVPSNATNPALCIGEIHEGGMVSRALSIEYDRPLTEKEIEIARKKKDVFLERRLDTYLDLREEFGVPPESKKESKTMSPSGKCMNCKTHIQIINMIRYRIIEKVGAPNGIQFLPLADPSDEHTIHKCPHCRGTITLHQCP